MPRILVADDNSNIQKMVGLALKDQGIDVVAVGNGEAAVRKISEIRPDLVLADVFMPVRNGYEVCQYVKQDPSLAHIPVILLVGAFDPLDEQEAQRVGADGVLKKPFVPPDPLISMVKSALARAGVAIAADAADKALEASPKKAADLLPLRPAAPAVPQTPSPNVVASVEPESLAEQVPSKRPDLTIAAGDKTLAFGNLLDTPGLTEEVDDSAFVTAKSTEFETDRNWGASEEESEDVPEEEDEEEETSSAPAWRRDGNDESQEAPAAAKPPKRDWRTVEPATARTVSKNPVEETADLTPILAAKSLPSFSGDAWAAAITAGTQEKIATEHQQEAPRENTVADVLQAPVQVAEASKIVETEDAKKPNTWTSSPWEVDAQTTGQLGSVWEAGANKGTTEAPEPAASEPAQEVAEIVQEQTPQFSAAESLLESEEAPTASPYAGGSLPPDIDAALIQAGADLQLPTETVHMLQAEIQAVVASQPEEKPAETAEKEEFVEEVPQAAEQNHTEIYEPDREPEAPVTEAAAAEQKATPSESEAAKAPEVDMEALVARVLARMSPEALQAVTREILKPVLETIIRDEINAKKS